VGLGYHSAMLSNRARRIVYLEKLVDLRRKEKKRLVEILKNAESESKKLRTNAYLEKIEDEVEAELAEIETLLAK
jgi:protein-L-isoaspartate O-methyltransferase